MALGEYLGRTAEAGDVVTLTGDLGAGKTTLTQFVGRGLLVPADCYITSPTFAVMHEYPGRLPLYHMDFYRLSGADDIVALGLDEYLYGDGLCIIEWPDRLEDLVPDERLELELSWVSENSRRIRITYSSANWRKRVRELCRIFS